MSRKYILLMFFICSYLLIFLPLVAQEEQGEIIIIGEQVGKEIDQEEGERFKFFQNLSKHQTVSSDSGETQARKVDADSSRKKTLCLSIGFGYPIYEGGPQPSLGAPVSAFSLRLLEFPIAYMFSGGGGLSRHKERVTALQHEYSYDIHSILYMIPLSKSKKTIFFLGGGIDSIKIKIENPYNVGYTHQKYTLYNFEVGCNPRLRGFLGYHTKVRYLYSKWSNSCIQFILGIDFNFHFRI